jgi:hypothetical protein
MLARTSRFSVVAAYGVTLAILVTATVMGAAHVIALMDKLASRAAGLDDPRADLEDAIAELKTFGESSLAAWADKLNAAHAETVDPKGPQSGSGSVLAVVNEIFTGGEGTSDGAQFYSGVGGTYRTVCVRLCDGYSWPISFSTTPDYFARDKNACEQSCGMPARLYVYRTPGGRPEDMTSLSGEPYSKLRTAYQFRVRYEAACTCRGKPWDGTAMARHREYAMDAAADKAAREAAAGVKGRKARRLAATTARAEVEAAYEAKASTSADAATADPNDPAAAASPPGAPVGMAVPFSSPGIDALALTASASEPIIERSLPAATVQISQAERERLAEERERMEEAMRLGATDREGSRRASTPSYRSGPTPVWESRAFSGN